MVQGTFDDLGTPLSSVTFVVVDLETTGGSPVECGITEIGAVKVRGGEVVGEFQTLVNPGAAIPAFISVLTGITDSMVAGAPRIEAALPAFLEFAAGSVLVAHNAGFDISFLKAAARRTEHEWPGFAVLDTVHLARQLVHRDEVPNHRLASLAVLFRATTSPDHRALHDARATVDVLHGLFERVGSLGVHSLEELLDYTARVTPARRRKRHLADDLPDLPGVYLFKDGQGRVLYVGTSVSIRTRVRSYFTASEHRRRMGEMVRIAESVSPIVCATTLEAEVRELRLIAEHKPRYNRRSRNPERALWVKLTVEPFPRLSIVRTVADDGARYAGPFGSRSSAEAAVAAVHEVLPLRQCLERLSPTKPRSACALADMGRCGAPCTGAQSVGDYALVADRAVDLLVGDTRDLLDALRARMTHLADVERFEDAQVVRERLVSLVRGTSRSQRLDPLARIAELVAARRSLLGGWEVVCVRYGRLAGSTTSPRGADPMPYIEALRASAEVVAPPLPPSTAATAEESEKVLRWLESPGVRIVEVEGAWTCPVGGAAAVRAELEPLETARREVAGFAGRPLDPGARLRWVGDHRHRPHHRRRRPHPRGRAGDRRPRRCHRGLLGRRRRRPHRDGPGPPPRGPRRRHRRPAQQGHRGHRHQHAHRVPHLLPARPRGGLQPRRRELTRLPRRFLEPARVPASARVRGGGLDPAGEHGLRRPGVDGGLRAVHALAHGRRERHPRHEGLGQAGCRRQRDAGVEQHRVAHRAGPAREQVARHLGVVGGVATAQALDRGVLEADVTRVEGEAR